MRLFLCLYTILVACFVSPAAAVQIIARVGDEIISDVDLSDRMHNLAVLNGVDLNKENTKQLKDIAFRDLVDELVFEYAAKEFELSVSQDDVDHAATIFCERAGLNKDKLKRDMESYGGSFDSFISQVRSRMLWDKVLSKKFGYLIEISDRDAESFLNNDRNALVYIVDVLLFTIPKEHISDTKEVTKLVKSSAYDEIASRYPYVFFDRHEMFLSEFEPSVSKEFLHAKDGKTIGYTGRSGEWLILKLEKRFSAKKFLFDKGNFIKLFSIKTLNKLCLNEFKTFSARKHECDTIQSDIKSLSCASEVSVSDLELKMGVLGYEQIQALNSTQDGMLTMPFQSGDFSTSLMLCHQKENNKKALLLAAKEQIYRDRVQSHSKLFLEQLKEKYSVSVESDF